MTYLLYWDLLDSPKRHAARLAADTFFLAETLVLLFLTNYTHAFGVLASIAAFRFGANLGNSRASFADRHMLPDLAIYITIIIGTVIAGLLRPSPIPAGRLFHRVDIELFALALSMMIISTIPLLHDASLAKTLEENEKFRAIEKLPDIPFGYRRVITAAGVLLLTGAAVVALLGFSHVGLIYSAAVVVAYGAIAPWGFEIAYGYRGHIMKLFALTLSIAVAVAYILRTPYEPYASSIIVKILAVLWSSAFALVINQIWREGNRKMLIPDQRPSHFIYTGLLGIAHVVVYLGWIHPLRPVAL